MSSGTSYGLRRVPIQDGGKLRVKLESDPATSSVVKRMFELALSGLGTKEVAKGLNVEGIPSPAGKRWGKSRVHATLVNEVYVGTLVWGEG